MNPFRFASPIWLVFLVPLIVAGLFDLLGRKKKPAIIFSTTEGFETIPPSFATRIKKYVPFLFYLGSALIVVALARPQCGFQETRVLGNGISIVMCVDRSGSMAAKDFSIDGIRVDRLTAVKKVFKEFAMGSKDFQGRPNDLIALITFGGFVDSRCPLTLDHQSLVELLEKIETPVPLYDRNGRVVQTQVLSEESGTAIGDALASAVNLIKDSTNKTKIVVLLSDGMQTTGALTPEEGIKIAQTYKIKVYTIGVGSQGLVPFPHYLPGGRRVMTERRLDFDPETLRTIAQATGGRYFHAEDVEGLRNVCEEIDGLERDDFDAGDNTRYRDVHYVLALLGIVALILYVALINTRYRTFP